MQARKALCLVLLKLHKELGRPKLAISDFLRKLPEVLLQIQYSSS